MLTWFTEMRGQKFIVTPRVLKIYCRVKLAVAGRSALTDEEYWYRSFKERYHIRWKKVSSLRRKKYTEEQLRREKAQWEGHVRELKELRGYSDALIVNMDEIPLYMDMVPQYTLDFEGGKCCEGNLHQQ